MSLVPVALDDQTYALYLQVPGPNVVLLQAVSETFEGLGTVRTIDIKRSIVCVLTTTSQLEECLRLLDSLAETIGWRPDETDPREHGDQFLGYGKKEG